MAMGSYGYAVYVGTHPNAKIYFKYGQLDDLVVEYVFDGRPLQRLDFAIPSHTAAADLAQFLIDKIGGVGGGAPA
jgi:hypothetical protein